MNMWKNTKCTRCFPVQDDDFNHNDFLYGNSTKADVYDNIIGIIAKY